MLEQRVRNRQPTALQGVGLILLIALAVFAGSAFFTMMQKRIGALSSALFIAYGCAIAWFLLNWYALSFIYTPTDDILRICRAYGKRERFMLDVWLNGIRACGELEDIKNRFPGAKVHRATKSNCPIPPLAVAFNDAGHTAILLLQPDAPLKDVIVGAVRR